ncbi:Transcriptional regulator, Cro/CI family (plasmid) [Mycetohabitans rhizoxinica HKI 454]|uniref:Transcriptional regulator, Cro/CI family n=2 Tax=Mycetohabitans rhizoxinica TaxID=412963 RepID=E5AVU9_MYCRK|nr:helix-turn-helix transcriptional regulator [Mycetohabitans rhizoxinica]MCG1048672.1 helix-turn-helix domain-containing protein [Mycetohabitans sp. B6]CBW77251.1 Transcriptional regulator, Cro/CI family [Mycetohabitans rhizoxinica HKI 454]
MAQENESRSKLARTIGQAIARQRRLRGLTQEQLSEAAGLAQASLSQIERGRVLPGLDRLAQLAQLLDCRLVDLVAEGGTGALDCAMRMHAKLAALSPTQQEALEHLLDEAIVMVTGTRTAARRRGRKAAS